MNTPKKVMARDEFYEAAMRPDTPDEMAFQIDRVLDDEMSFSQEAVDTTAEQFRTWLMARVVAHTTRTGKPPKHVRATAVLAWDPGDPFEDAGMYYRIDNDEGMTPLDGTRRKWESWS